MHLVVLGSGTSIFHPQRAAAGFWLETEKGSILLDCSADVPHRMAEENLDWSNLDAIWISHLHLDHCAGLAPFLFGIKWAPLAQNRRKPLAIFGCVGIEKLLRMIDESHNYKLFEQSFPVNVHEIDGAEQMDFEILTGVEVRTISTPHRPESLAIHISGSDGATLVYSSDTGYSEELAMFARGVDLFILECSFYRDKPVRTHLELNDAMHLAQQAQPRKLMLTHLYPEWDEIDLETKAAELWPGITIAARDGLRLEISR